MELNTRGRYAVMAMADLAKHGSDIAVALPGVAERQGISLSYLEQLFVLLRREGIVKSARGRSGGYRLARPAESITVAEIMFAVGEPVEMTRCAAMEFGGCVHNTKCLTHDLWRALGNHIIGFLEKISLQDILDGVSDGSRLAAPRSAITRPEARVE